MHGTQAAGGPCTMSGEAQRRPEWDLTHGGRVYRVTAEAGTVCTHAQASEAVYASHQRGGNRVYFEHGLTLRVQRLDDYPMVPPAARTPFDLRAAVMDSATQAVTAHRWDIPAPTPDLKYIVETRMSPPITKADAQTAVFTWVGAGQPDGVDTVRLSDYTLVTVKLANSVSPGVQRSTSVPQSASPYQRLRTCLLDQRLLAYVAQAEQEHDQMATDLAVAQAKLALVERAVKQLRVALGEVVPINHGANQ